MSDLPNPKKPSKETIKFKDLSLDKNMATLSAGYIIDELPQELTTMFLEQIGLIKKEDILTRHTYLTKKQEEAKSG